MSGRGTSGAVAWLRTVAFLVRKETLQVVRDRMLMFQLITPPLIQLLVITSAATFEVKQVDVHLIDFDRTPASARLVEAVVASGRFDVVGSTPSPSVADRAMLRDDVGMVLHVPAGFQRDLVRTGTADVQLVLDGTEGATAGVAAQYARSAIRQFAAQRAAGEGPATDRRGTHPEVAVHARGYFNPTGDHTHYMAPGILVILVTIVGTLMTAINIAREKEQGTIEQLNVTPLSRSQFVAGKLTPFWFLGLVELALGLVVARLVFAVPFAGSLLIVFAGAAVYLLVALGLGLLISSASSTQQQAQFIALFVMVIYLFLSGLLTPVSSMPQWGRWLAALTPMTHMIELMRDVLIRGAGWAEVAVSFWWMAGMAAVVLPLAVATYSKRAS